MHFKMSSAICFNLVILTSGNGLNGDCCHCNGRKKIEGNAENTGYQHFLLLPQSFQESYPLGL